MKRFNKTYGIFTAVAVLSLVASCKTVPPIVVTARTMTAMNTMFEGTHAAMEAALDAKHITKDQYKQWKSFGLRYQASAELARKLYDAALESKDDTTRAHAEAILADFQNELGVYAALVLNIAHPDGGQ